MVTALAALVHCAGTLAALAALAGCAYLLAAIVVVRRAAPAEGAAPADRARPAVTILKPLHGAEPELRRRLLSFCDQRYGGEVQIVFGCQDASDPAIAIVRTVMALRPDHALDLVVDARLHGSNRKVSNLLHCHERARHDVLVLADSDIEVDPNYLARVVDTLEQPGVGAVTCLYEGTGCATGAALSAQAINAHFLPNTLVGLTLGAATPCCGSTIALHRATLTRIGGFAAIADRLADDYAVGEAVRRLGLAVKVAPFIVRHACGEATVGSFFTHQLRFARTIRSIDPLGHAGSLVTNPLPFALVALCCQIPLGGWIVAVCLAGRVALLGAVVRRYAMARQRLWLVPFCDLAVAVAFVASFLGSGVEWRGHRFRSLPGGTLVPTKDLTPA